MNIPWGAFIFGIAADVFLAGIIARFTQDRDWLVTAGFVFLVILAGQAASTLWSAAKGWAAYAMFARTKTKRLILAELHRLDMPSTKANVSIDAYLGDVLAEKELLFKKRAKAAFWLGELAAYRTTRPLTMGLMTSGAFEEAMSEYSKPLPTLIDEEEFESELRKSLDEPLPQVKKPIEMPVTRLKPTALDSRPWPRFWARIIDTALFSFPLSFGIALCAAIYAPKEYLQLMAMSDGLWNLLLLPLASIALALCMTAIGTTPGKAILSVNVLPPTSRSRFRFYLAREFKVWLIGMGLGIPIVSLLTMGRQHRLLTEGKAASYDEGNPLVVANPSKRRFAGGIAIALILLAGQIYMRFAEQQSSIQANLTQLWVNPVTRQAATIPKAWQAEEMKTNSGRVFYFAAPDLLAEALLGYEQFDGGDSTVYANAIKNAISSDVTIGSDWTPVTIHGIQTLRATGKAVKFVDTNVEVTVALIGKNAWRTLVFAKGRSVDQLPGKDAFVEAMFGTAN